MHTQTADKPGFFGEFGGRYVPETLVPALDELENAYRTIVPQPHFQAELDGLLRDFVGRATPLYHAKRVSAHLGGAQIWLKREDLAHTGAHKINNAVGQALLARDMGKQRIIAETGAGQHGVATAAACALLGLECHVYMGAEDVRRQRANALRMRLLGAELVAVDSGSCTLKDAINEAIRDWVTNVETTHYVIGSVVGPAPYPEMVRDFHAVIGNEAREQMLSALGRLPDEIHACVGGGSNAMGIFHAFVGDEQVRLVGIEGGGHGPDSGKDHAATLAGGRVGVLHGARSYLLQDQHGQVAGTHSVSAGLDYPGVGPEHSHLRDIGRVAYSWAADQPALEALKLLSRMEGILPALETSHALAYAFERAPQLASEQIILVNLSGRGDKDLEIVEGLV